MVHKKAILLFAAFLTAGFAYGFDLEISGEIRSGIMWDYYQEWDHQEDAWQEDHVSLARIHVNDGSSDFQGLFRMNMNISHGNVGAMIRFEQTHFASGGFPYWAYAFGYGIFLDDMIRVSVGQLGLSPWGSVKIGPRQSENALDHHFGIRTEISPLAVPGLTFGFVLNSWDLRFDPIDDQRSLGDMLMESVLGVTFTNDFFHGRLAWRLDGQADGIDEMDIDLGRVVFLQEGHQMMYHLEARIPHIPDLSLWTTGWFRGVVGAERDYFRVSQNWLYAEFAPPAFRATLGLGLETRGNSDNFFTASAGFHYNVLPFLTVGSNFIYTVNFGENRMERDVLFYFMSIEPEIRLNISASMFFALVYGYFNGHVLENEALHLRRGHWVNLRAVITF